MTSFFSHGRLRLYLLKLISDGPKHGYELIRLIDRQFRGAYVPSAGTVYPRLARLEDEGLITHTVSGDRKVYAITHSGWSELLSRAAEVSVLEADLQATAMTAGPGSPAPERGLDPLDRPTGTESARAGRAVGTLTAYERDCGVDGDHGPTPGAALELRVIEFVADLRRLVRGARTDLAAADSIGRTLDATLAQIRRALR